MAKFKVSESVEPVEVVEDVKPEPVEVVEDVKPEPVEVVEVKRNDTSNDINYASQLLGWSPRRLPDDVAKRLLNAKVASYAGDGLYKRGAKWKQFTGLS